MRIESENLKEELFIYLPAPTDRDGAIEVLNREKIQVHKAWMNSSGSFGRREEVELRYHDNGTNVTYESYQILHLVPKNPVPVAIPKQFRIDLSEIPAEKIEEQMKMQLETVRQIPKQPYIT